MTTNGTTSPPRARAWRWALAYERAVDALNERVGRFTPYIVIVVVVVGFTNVVLRYLGRFIGTRLVNNYWLESQWYMYSLVFLLGFGYILKHQINVRVDFWWADQPLRRKVWIDLVGHLISLVPFSILALWVTWPWVLSSFTSQTGSFTTWRVWEIWENSPDPSGLPRAPIKAMILVGFALLLLQGLAELVKLVAVLTGHEDWVELPVEHEAPMRIE
ncbi:MAG TPA: TRAP transporter small permease subunit [Actinobacteria bacterium]|nr:TRAP transporter small permease subunit [Actinomycetota bacterium]